MLIVNLLVSNCDLFIIALGRQKRTTSIIGCLLVLFVRGAAFLNVCWFESVHQCLVVVGPFFNF